MEALNISLPVADMLIFDIPFATALNLHKLRLFLQIYVLHLILNVRELHQG